MKTVQTNLNKVREILKTSLKKIEKVNLKKWKIEKMETSLERLF